MSKVPLVVCVDDDEAMLSTVVRCLKREQVEIRSTLSASEALGWVAADEVAVLISDYEMPEMTGAQLAGHARRVRPETVRILLTGKRTLETAIDGINQGEIFKFIAKPFDHKLLREIVDAAIARHRELAEWAGDRARRERGRAMREELEAAFPRIGNVAREPDGRYVVRDPLALAGELGLPELVDVLANTR
jgi:DNA-binding NtrC family response regulator